MSSHRKLSPSAAHRWMNCPGSVALIGDESSKSNPAARLGTAVHKLIETCVLNGDYDAASYRGWFLYVDPTTADRHPLIGRLSLVGWKEAKWEQYQVDDDIIYSAQATLDVVKKFADGMFEPETFAERFLDMSWLDPRLGGTADITLVEPFGVAHLVDHKNGRVLVEVEDNEQLKNYAVGVLHEHPDADEVWVTISQPNAGHDDGLARTAKYTRDELKLFEIQMAEAAKAVDAPNALRRVGDWCKWCPAKSRCPEFEQAMKEEAQAEFGDDWQGDPPAALPIPKGGAELAAKAKWAPLFEMWAKDIQKAIGEELMSSREVPGWKLVYKRSNRRWIDEPAAIAELLAEGVNGILTEPKLKSPAQVERLGKGAKEAVKSLTMKPPAGLTVARADDKRDAVNPTDEARSEFAGDDEEERTPPWE